MYRVVPIVAAIAFSAGITPPAFGQILPPCCTVSAEPEHPPDPDQENQGTIDLSVEPDRRPLKALEAEAKVERETAWTVASIPLVDGLMRDSGLLAGAAQPEPIPMPPCCQLEAEIEPPHPDHFDKESTRTLEPAMAVPDLKPPLITLAAEAKVEKRPRTTGFVPPIVVAREPISPNIRLPIPVFMLLGIGLILLLGWRRRIRLAPEEPPLKSNPLPASLTDLLEVLSDKSELVSARGSSFLRAAA